MKILSICDILVTSNKHKLTCFRQNTNNLEKIFLVRSMQMVVLEEQGVRLELEKSGRRDFYGKVKVPMELLQQNGMVQCRGKFKLEITVKKPAEAGICLTFKKAYRMAKGRYDVTSDVVLHYQDECCKIMLTLKAKVYVSPSVRKFNNKKQYCILERFPKNPKSSPPKTPQYKYNNVQRPYQGGAVCPK
mgnify:CR=1 FL=1